MKVLIQGAGIAGLALGAMLKKENIDYVIVERATELKPVGAGITLSANALACLAEIIDIEKLRSRGVTLNRLLLTDELGNLLSEVPAKLDEQMPAGLGIKRSDLHEALLEANTLSSLQLGSKIKSVQTNDRPYRVFLENGEVINCDVLVGADGIKSEVRNLLPKIKSKILYSGYTCWRGIVTSLPAVAEAFEAWGQGCRLGVVAVSPSETYVFATLNMKRGDGRNSIHEYILSHFKSFYHYRYLEEIMSRESSIQNDIEELSEPAWGEKSIVLIGDAAHAMTPNLGQGAAMGIEDALALSKMISTRTDDLATELRDERERRVTWIAKKSRELGTAGQLENPTACWVRNRALQLTPSFIMRENLRRMLKVEMSIK